MGVPVKTGISVEYDLENKPLYIKTDSLVGSNEVLEVNFEDSAGNVVITFASHPTYSLLPCLMNELPSSLPSSDIKVWKITLSRTAGVRRVEIHCNGVEVISTPISAETCKIDTSAPNYYWAGIAKRISFGPGDTASDSYSSPSSSSSGWSECTKLINKKLHKFCSNE